MRSADHTVVAELSCLCAVTCSAQAENHFTPVNLLSVDIINLTTCAYLPHATGHHLVSSIVRLGCMFDRLDDHAKSGFVLGGGGGEGESIHCKDA